LDRAFVDFCFPGLEGFELACFELACFELACFALACFDLALLDFCFPGLAGFELARFDLGLVSLPCGDDFPSDRLFGRGVFSSEFRVLGFRFCPFCGPEARSDSHSWVDFFSLAGRGAPREAFD
jgi:hypothetical protein